MLASVLVPYRPDGGHRDRAWAWNRWRWENLLDVELIVESPGPGSSPADFNHPRAINAAARRASSDVFIVADADTAFDPDWVVMAVGAVRRGAARWVLPARYLQLTPQATGDLLGSDPARRIAEELSCDWIGEAVSWSGLVIVSARAFAHVGGYDERWEQWGGDDVAFACAMNTLWGPVDRRGGRAVHCWHPRDELDAQPKGQHNLMYRYLEADGDPVKMREVMSR